jgi:hypothetical protein
MKEVTWAFWVFLLLRLAQQYCSCKARAFRVFSCARCRCFCFSRVGGSWFVGLPQKTLARLYRCLTGLAKPPRSQFAVVSQETLTRKTGFSPETLTRTLLLQTIPNIEW